jgi:hypothetical protein
MMLAMMLFAIVSFLGALFPSHPASVPPPAILSGPPLQRLIVVVDHTGNDASDAKAATAAAIVLHHFARETSWTYIDDLDETTVRNADAVVYFGRRSSVPAASFERLRVARRLIVFEQHLGELKTIGFFPHVTRTAEVDAPAHAQIHYKGQRFGVIGSFYTRFTVSAGAATYGTIAGTPFAVVDGPATFIAAPLTFTSEFRDPYAQGSWLAACDILRIGLGVPPAPKIALLRFEDVSVEVPTDRMRAIADYMASRDLPYGIGVIPSQLIRGVNLEKLAQDPSLVDVLRFAQAHGARIVLHGFHHSYNSPEDFEFWDAVHQRPLPNDSDAWMRDRIAQGLEIERGLGLDPVMWESPHYAASPLDYGVVATFFGTSWERRRPVAFLPWALQRDAYGSVLLPENLGYDSVRAADRRMSLDQQLSRARAFAICADCIPAGFLHPSTVPLADVIDFVNGIEALGYRFADPLGVMVPETHV